MGTLKNIRRSKMHAQGGAVLLLRSANVGSGVN